MPLKDIAAATHMPRAKVHRYLSSLRKSGLVEQSAETSHYRIGATAIAIGLTGLRRINPIAEVCAALPALRDRIAQLKGEPVASPQVKKGRRGRGRRGAMR